MDRLQLPKSPSNFDTFSPDNGSAQGYLKGCHPAISNSPSWHSRESPKYVLSDTAGRFGSAYDNTKGSRISPTRPSNRGEVTVLESQLENMTALKDQFAKKCRETEEKLHEYELNNHGKLLEGKLNALQKLLKERSSDVDINHERALTAEKHVSELRTAATQHQLRRDELERIIVQRDSEKSRFESELTSLKNTKSILETELTKQLETTNHLESLQHQSNIDKQRNMSLLREDTRSKDLQIIQAGEVEVCLKKETAELTNTVAALRDEGKSKTDLINELTDRNKTQQEGSNQLQVRVSQLAALLDTQQQETERELKKSQQLTIDISQCNGDKNELMVKIGLLEAELLSFEAKAEKFKILENCLNRSNEDIKEEAARHTITKRRVEDLELRSESVALLKNQLKDKEVELNQLAVEIESQHSRYSSLEDLLSKSRVEIDTSEAQNRHLSLEIQHLTSQHNTLQSDAAQLREETSKINLLEGKVRGLESIVETKESEIQQYSEDAIRKTEFIRELQLASSTAEALVDEVESYRNDKKELEHRVMELDQLRRDASAAADRNASESDQLCELLKIKTTQLTDMETELQTAQTELSIIDQLRDRITILEEDLIKKTDELHQHDQQTITLRSQLASSSSDLELLRDHYSNMEIVVGDKTNKIQSLAEKLGSAQVTAEISDSELDKSKADNKTLALEMTKLTSELNRQSDELRSSKENIHREQYQSKELRETVDAQNQNISHLETQVHSLQSQLRSAQELQAQLEAKLLSSEDIKSRESHTASQLSELQQQLLSGNYEIQEKEKEIVQLKINAKGMELQIGRSQQLADYNNDMKSQIADYINTLDSLEADTRRKGEQIHVLEQQKLELESKIGILTTDLSSSNTNINSMAQKLEVFEKRQTKYLENEGRIVGLEAGLTKKESELREVLEQNNALSCKIKQLDETILTNSATAEKQRTQQSEISNKNEVIQHLENEISKLRSSISDMHLNEEKSSRKIAIVEEELQRAVQNGHSVELKLRDTEVESSAVIRELRNEVQIEENHKNSLQREVTSLKERLQHEESQLRYQLQRCKEVERELQDKGTKITHLEEDCGRATVEWNAIVEQLKEEREISQNSSKAIQSLQGEIEASRQNVDQQRVATDTHEQRLHSEIKVKSQQIDSLSDQVKETRHELCLARDQVLQQNKQLHTEQDKSHRASQQLKSKQQELDRNVRVLEDSRHRTDEWMRKLRETEEKLHESDRKKQEKEREITLVQNSLSDMQRRYDGAMTKLNTQRDVKQIGYGGSLDSSRELTEAKAKLARAEAELSRQQVSNDDSRWLRSELDQAKEKILSLQTQCNVRTHYSP